MVRHVGVCSVCGADLDPEVVRCPYCRSELAGKAAGGYTAVGLLLTPMSPVFLYAAWLSLSTAVGSYAGFGPLEVVLVAVYNAVFLGLGLLGPGLLLAEYARTDRYRGDEPGRRGA